METNRETQKPSNKKVDDAYAAYIARQTANQIETNVKTLIIILLASVMMAVNMNTFINQGDLLPGGANGVIVLIRRVFEKFFGIALPFSPLSIAINAVPAYMAYKTVGKKFTLFSCLCILLMSVMTDLIPGYPLTEDKLLISVFGGIINGLAISLVLNAGACTGGSDFVAMYFSTKKGISTWNYVLMFNAAIILISGCLFGMESALYTIIFQFVQTQILNARYQRYSKKTVFIITDCPDAVTEQLMSVTHHSATVFRAQGAYTNKEHYVIYMILSAEEVQRVRKLVREIDEKAFINVMRSESVTGNFYVRPIG